MHIGFKYHGPSAVIGALAFSVYQGMISPWWIILCVALLFEVPAFKLGYWMEKRNDT